MADNGKRPKAADAPPGATAHTLDVDAEWEATAEAQQTLSDLDQSHSDADQTASDSDQAAGEADEAASYADQKRADLDQQASDRDQAAADRDQANPATGAASLRAYDLSRRDRAGGSSRREATAASRLAGALARTRRAMRRDETARIRDLTALARDRAAEARDRAAQRQVASINATRLPPDGAVRAVQESGAALRARSAADRAEAAADRDRAAADRERAAADRRQARIDLQRAHLDDLTGVHTRALGQVTLQHEIDRAERSGEPFVLAFIDVDGLKEINDREGHAAGDAVLEAVAAALKSKVRSYDPIVRIGGDEFVCGFTNTSLEAARRRARMIQAALEHGSLPRSVSVGLAELRPGDTLEDLTARGDADLYASKHAS
jgi:diguanylate cyclase (GGDEF)-like protein